MSATRPTFVDLAKLRDPDGGQAMVVERLFLNNPMLQDGPMYPSNAKMAERTTLRSSLPTVQFAQFNQGTVRSMGGYVQRADTIAFVDALAEVDARLQEVEGADEINNWRFQEEKGFHEAMNQLYITTALYGDELTSPQSFTGFAPRLSTLATDVTDSQVRSAGTVVGGDGTSIFVVDWGKEGVHWIYPKDGRPGGFHAEDLGRQRVTDRDSNPFMAWCSAYTWLMGLAVKDPRHVGRLANIDLSDAQLEFPTQGNLVMMLIDLLTGMPAPGGLQRVLYCHRQLEAAFWKQALNKANMALSIRDYLGMPTAHFWGYPIRSLDGMSIAESTVS